MKRTTAEDGIDWPTSALSAMDGFNFTERVRKVIGMAREEAVRLHHEYVGTEHILLGIIRERRGVAATMLQNLSVDFDEVELKVQEMVRQGRSGQLMGRDLPYTAGAKRVLELSMIEARELHHPYVGTEHLLVALLRQEKGIAAQALFRVGLTEDSARREMLQILGEPMPPPQAAS